MTLGVEIPTCSRAQRARGLISASADYDPVRGSVLKTLRQEGSYRTVFPRTTKSAAGDAAVGVVMINTAGGVTCGDRFSATFSAHENACISVTTQAAERIYRAAHNDTARISTSLKIAKGAKLFWLPQETILFDGSRLTRRLLVDVDPEGTFVMVEPLVFGRTASGEDLKTGAFSDNVSIRSDGKTVFLDQVVLGGGITAVMQRKAIANGAKAMASAVLVDPNAREKLTACRHVLPDTAGASLLSDGILVVRVLAPDSFALRKTLLPVLQLLTDNAVPKNWKL